MSRNRFKYPKLDTISRVSPLKMIFTIKVGRNRYVNVDLVWSSNNEILSIVNFPVYDNLGILHPEYAVNEMDIIDVVKVNRQINDFFADAVDNSADELDTYSELLSYGYTVAQIRKYCGNEMGTHMEIFCRAHGLL